MPHTCIVVDCGSRSNRDEVSFFAVPAILNHKHAVHLNELSKHRRDRWIAAIKRADLTATKLKNQKVCSRHFITGKPATLEDVNHPDWASSQSMGYTSGPNLKRKTDVARKTRLDNRKKLRLDNPCTPEFSEISTSDEPEETIENSEVEETGVYTQTSITTEELSSQLCRLNFADKKIEMLNQKLYKSMLTAESLQVDDEKTKFYTGLNYKVLAIVYKYIEKYISYSHNSALQPFQQLLLTMMKLRLNLNFKDLAYRFNISPTTASTYFTNIIEILYRRFKSLIIWPDRSVVNKNIPTCFKEAFKEKTTIIIDCFEVFIQKPANYLTNQQCWSNYKHHTTIKFLIGITPQGTVSYISNAWGGRTSDKQIVENSTFLNYVQPNDVILADRGFLIKDTIAMFRAKLVIPAFTKGKSQLNPIDVEETRQIAHVRIHVERVIGVVKSKFTILQGPIPITMLTYNSENLNLLDKLVTVCCALINICPSVVPL